jgi:hypothetical protein
MELLGEGSVEFMLRVFDFKCMTVYALQIKRSFFFFTDGPYIGIRLVLNESFTEGMF